MLTKDIIDALVPQHTKLRYASAVTCSDEHRVGGYGYDFADKEWRCKRCCLLDMLDGLAPDYAELHLEVLNTGNVL